MTYEFKTTLDWENLFPEQGFKHRMGVEIILPTVFCENEDPTGSVREERCRWVAHSPELYVAVDMDVANTFHAFSNFGSRGMTRYTMPDRTREQLVESGIIHAGHHEWDWVVLRPDANQIYNVIAGVVCFPSNWALHEKLGKPIHKIHDVVPGLNEALGRQINQFLSKLKPNLAWGRDNWGLSADAELNHHPSRQLKRLGADAKLDKTWVRLERQLFYKFDTGDILFAIRVNHFALNEVVMENGAAQRIAHVLQTMPEPVAVYKGIAEARKPLIEQLKALAR